MKIIQGIAGLAVAVALVVGIAPTPAKADVDVSFGLFYNDLSPHGSWYVSAQYGRVWQPYFVNLTWSPFADGAWIWYPHAGYVFVSSYPWGWAPYRYGSWVFIGGRGWCWRPGTSFVSWWTAPVFHNPPPVFIAPHRPVVIPPHRQPILVGNGGPGPVHPGGDGRGR